MSHEENMMDSSDELDKELEAAFKDCEEKEELNFPRMRLERKFISVPNLVDEDENLDDNFMEPTDDKVGRKRQLKKDELGLEKHKKRKKKNKQETLEIEEMWDSITNSKDGDEVRENCPKKNDDDDDYEIAKLFNLRRKNSKEEKNTAEIALQVEQVMATLEIAVEDDVELNREGKPAINKLVKLPLLFEALSKKPLQAEFLDRGILGLLKNWLEPLPDGSLPSINIRTAILKILNDLCIKLDQDYGKEQLTKSGLGKVIMFLSKSEEETTPNRRLANDLVNKWGHIIYNKSTRYANMNSPEEREEQKQKLLRREIKKASKVSKPIARDFDIDVDLSVNPKSKLAACRGVGRAKIPEAISMNFELRPNSKVDVRLKSRAKMQMNNATIRERITSKLQKKKSLGRKSLQALKPSADGRTMLKFS